MQQISQFASEIYMIILCLVAGPADQSEVRIDQLGNRGLIDTLIVQHTNQAFFVFDESNGRRVLFMTIQRQEGNKGVFIAKGPNGREEVIDVSAEIANLQTLEKRPAAKQALKTKAGSQIQIARSGSVTYLNEVGSPRTFVVHSEQAK